MLFGRRIGLLLLHSSGFQMASSSGSSFATASSSSSLTDSSSTPRGSYQPPPKIPRSECPTQLDLSLFESRLSLMALCFPAKLTNPWIGAIKVPGCEIGINRPLLRVIQPHPESRASRLLLLNEALSDSIISTLPAATQDESLNSTASSSSSPPSSSSSSSSKQARELRVSSESWPLHEKLSLFPRDVIERLETQSPECIAQATLVKLDVSLTIDHFSIADVLRRLIPEELSDLPTSYEHVGHIAHLNLRDEFLRYRFLIGETILMKQAGVRTVVNKEGTIHAQFRTFPMELLAGDDDFIVTHIENECRFRFDFSKVYWNSRLQGEHERLVNLFRPGQVICDMMAGVGPFAIPAAKRGSIVYANDLNPDSYASLVDNKSLNKIRDSHLHCSNLDAREFARRMLHGTEGKAAIPFQHAVMNLPATAIEFLDVFRGVVLDWPVPPTVHCYCFSPAAPGDFPTDIHERIKEVLGATLELNIHHVRSVAPAKEMYCVSFTLPNKRPRDESGVAE